MPNLTAQFLVLTFLIWFPNTLQQQLHIAGLYPYPSAKKLGATPDAVQLALEHINSDPTILSSYDLTVKFRDSGCSNVVAVKSLFKFIREPDQKYLVVLGAACSVATALVAELAIAENLPTISYASTSTSLTNNERFPELLLGTPSDINTVFGQLLFIQKNNFRRVAIINQQEELFVSISARLQVFLNQLGISYLIEIFSPKNENYLDTIDILLGRIQNEGYRVIVVNMYEAEYVHMLCRLRKFPSLHPPSTTWIVLGWYVNWSDDVENVTNGECTNEEVVAISNGSVAVNPSVNFENFESVNQPTISGYTPRELFELYKAVSLSKNTLTFFEKESNFYDAFAYDCTWTIALALNEMAASHNLSTAQLKSTELFDAMQNVRFTGWTGEVRYVDRVRPENKIQLFEIINGSFLIRGLFVDIPANQSELVGNGSIAYREISPFIIFDFEKATDGIEVHYIHTSIFALTVIIFLLGLAYVTVLIVIISIGWVKRYAAVIKSEPSVNILIISGNYFIFLLALLWSIDGRYLQTRNNQFLCTFVCHLRIWLFSVSINIIFGGMLGKAIKYYVIAIKHKFRYSTYLKFYHILLLPLFLILLDTTYILVWGLVNPITYTIFNIESGLISPPIYQVAECRPADRTSSIILFTIFICCKSILVLIGLFLAYHLRKVLNKANKYTATITWTMYNTVIFSILQVILILLLTDINIKYGLVCFFTLLEGFVLSSIVVCPILYYLYKDPHGKTFESVILKDEFPEFPELLKEKIRTLEKQNLELQTRIQNDMEVSGIVKAHSNSIDEAPKAKEFNEIPPS